jgi:threonine dehydrogenase-like Zn-dependent dehydrogenase
MPDTHDEVAFDTYKSAHLPLPTQYRRWHLYGAGLENVGKEGQPETLDLPQPGPNEILVRHDACGICYSDIKIIALGGNHPRLVGRDLPNNPVVMGHEVALTVVAVGENNKDRFQIGQRFIVQADVFYNGVNLAYGYALSGGMSQFGLVGPEVLDGDEGCYLLPIEEETGYAEAALVEPWACVEAAYHWHHRSEPKPGGTFGVVFSAETTTPNRADSNLDNGTHGITLHGALPLPLKDDEKFDDLSFIETPTADLFEAACAHLGKDGIACLLLTDGQRMERPVKVDVGRVHYDGHRYVGTTRAEKSSTDIERAYTANTRAEIKGGGNAWFIGAAGPMGQMHVQRALSLPVPPKRIVGTDRQAGRLVALKERFGPIAESLGVELLLFNIRTDGMPDLNALAPNGFDDIVVMVPYIDAIEHSFPFLAQDGVLNVFAGVARGTTATLDMNDIVTKNVRIVGTTGSTIADMRTTRDKMEQGNLDTGASLAAIGGLNAFRDGLEAVQGGKFPGKTVIFPQIEDLPLTPLSELANVRPNVAAKLKDGKFWTNEAEEELLSEVK